MKVIEFKRRELGMSQREFGEYVGIDASYICNAERHGIMYPGHLERIVKKLGIDGDGKALLDEATLMEVK